MFGKNLKYLRIVNNLTQEELGKQIGFAKTTIAGWEADRFQPDINTLIKIAHFFNVSVDVLLGTGLTDRDTDSFLKLKNALKENGLPNDISKNDIEMLMKQFEIYKQYKNKDD